MHLPLVRPNINWLWLAFALFGIAAALILLPTTNAVIVIGGALALIAILRVPELALYALVFAVPYGSWFPISVGAGNVTAVDLLVALVLALWLARMIAKERAIVVHWPPLSLPFAIFLFAALLSTTGALSFQVAMKEFAKWAEMFAVYVFVANDLIQPHAPKSLGQDSSVATLPQNDSEPNSDNVNQARLTRILIAMMLAGLSEAAIGTYQFLFRAGPDGFLLFNRFIRAYGTFEQPNPYAGFLGLGIPIAFAIAFTVISGWWLVGRKNFTLSTAHYSLAAFGAIAFIAMSAALGMSWSRGAWIGVGAGLVITVIVQSRRALVLSIAGAALLAFVIWLSAINIIPNAIAARFEGIADYFGVFDVRGVKVDDANYAIVERMAHWQSAWEMFSEHPLLGIGFGNYQVVYPAYALPGWSDPLGHAHNYILNVAAEAGAVGLAAYGILWLAAFVQAWRAVRVSQGVWRGIAAGLLGVLVTLTVHNMFDNLFVHGMHVQVGIVLGIIASLGNHQWQTNN